MLNGVLSFFKNLGKNWKFYQGALPATLSLATSLFSNYLFLSCSLVIKSWRKILRFACALYVILKYFREKYVVVQGFDFSLTKEILGKYNSSQFSPPLVFVLRFSFLFFSLFDPINGFEKIAFKWGFKFFVPM